MLSVSAQAYQLLSTPSPPSRPLLSRFSSKLSPFSSRPLSAAPMSSSNSSSRSGYGSTIVAKGSVSEYGSGIGDLLGEVGVFTASGEPVLFKDLWDQKEGVTVVALLRHFGCICCWELASVLKETKPIFDSAGVKLIAVGVGPPHKARILAERLPFPEDCLYADPDHKAYDVLGLYNGLGRTFFNPASVKVFSRGDSFKKAAENYTIKATPGNISSVLQQGGVFVFRGKELLYARKDEGTGDHAPLEDVFSVCCKAPAV